LAFVRRLGTAPTFDAPYWLEAQLWQQVCPTLVCGPSRFTSAVIAVLYG
jgi:hypothetical protein